jgi:ABC-type polysaccharide/polyol phosphate transport system ATPase subunit
MSSDTLIRAKGLGKFYPHHLSGGRLLRYLAPWPQRANADDFWALRDFDLELKRGEVVGLVGANGSGKSTFLQLAAGLLEPSGGDIEVNGSTAALLELGAGFNPEFTGRENIYISGRVYGYSIKEIERLFQPIVDFADIGDHLDQPVKTYSSGMYARLAFSVAIQVEPEILLVDEILSVGDLGFQAKCFRRIEEMKERGMSILFVSHDLNTMQMLCDRLVLLEDGRKIIEGLPKDVARTYTERLSRKTGTPLGNRKGRTPNQPAKAQLEDIRLVDTQDQEIQHPVVGETYWIKYRIRFLAKVIRPVVSAQFKTLVGLVVADLTSMIMRQRIDDAQAGEIMDVAFRWTCHFCPGPYRIGVGVAETTDGAPIPLCGVEALSVEIIADQPAYGITHVEPELTIQRSGPTP